MYHMLKVMQHLISLLKEVLFRILFSKNHLNYVQLNYRAFYNNVLASVASILKYYKTWSDMTRKL